ncbi:hypothetical protein, partial [uncultured Corynebacterium sp.]|uniref:hypothetical protein n=1 Tax=uncultured Corynebacterium sp. TaxID=159447 RepID=UPI0025FAE218
MNETGVDAGVKKPIEQLIAYVGARRIRQPHGQAGLAHGSDHLLDRQRRELRCGAVGGDELAALGKLGVNAWYVPIND